MSRMEWLREIWDVVWNAREAFWVGIGFFLAFIIEQIRDGIRLRRERRALAISLLAQLQAYNLHFISLHTLFDAESSVESEWIFGDQHFLAYQHVRPFDTLPSNLGLLGTDMARRIAAIHRDVASLAARLESVRINFSQGTKVLSEYRSELVGAGVVATTNRIYRNLDETMERLKRFASDRESRRRDRVFRKQSRRAEREERRE